MEPNNDRARRRAEFCSLPEAEQMRIAERLIAAAIAEYGRIILTVAAEEQPPFNCEWRNRRKGTYGIGFDCDDLERAVPWVLEALRAGYPVRISKLKHGDSTNDYGPDFVGGTYRLMEGVRE